MRSVRIYGFTNGFGSYAQVTCGVALGLRDNGYTELEVKSLENQASFDEESVGLPTADAAILTGPPSAAAAMIQNARHKLRLAFVHPNSDTLPKKTMLTVNECATHILAASTWSAPIISRYSHLPIIVVPHGVHTDFFPELQYSPLEQLYEQGEFRVLHMSSSDHQRKGTIELCEAWSQLMLEGALPKQAMLTLVLTAGGKERVLEWMMDHPAPAMRVLPRFGIDGAAPSTARTIYRSVHVVCQPSRGEAFGMVGPEALACGTPIVATRATGHTQWFYEGLPGAVEVATGPVEPIDDLPGANAPSLNADAVAKSLLIAYRGWHAIKASALGNAEAFRDLRSWKRQVKEFSEWLQT